MQKDITIERIREHLIGSYFTTKTELRHLAERVGFDFVPVEFLSEDDKEAVVAITPKDMGKLHVRGVRDAPWERFFIVGVEAA